MVSANHASNNSAQLFIVLCNRHQHSDSYHSYYANSGLIVKRGIPLEKFSNCNLSCGQRKIKVEKEGQ